MDCGGNYDVNQFQLKVPAEAMEGICWVLNGELFVAS